jgi:hypothetical protein
MDVCDCEKVGIPSRHGTGMGDSVPYRSYPETRSFETREPVPGQVVPAARLIAPQWSVSVSAETGFAEHRQAWASRPPIDSKVVWNCVQMVGSARESVMILPGGAGETQIHADV